MAACQEAVSSREFTEWAVYGEMEPFGPRVVPDLLALLIALTYNMNRKVGARPLLPVDVHPDPLAPRRLSEAEEAGRKLRVMADYRRLRAERLAAKGA